MSSSGRPKPACDCGYSQQEVGAHCVCGALRLGRLEPGLGLRQARSLRVLTSIIQRIPDALQQPRAVLPGVRGVTGNLPGYSSGF